MFIKFFRSRWISFVIAAVVILILADASLLCTILMFYDEDLVAEVAQTIKEELGADKLAPDCGGGGEDFHYFKQTKPNMKAAYFGLGAGCTPGLHARNMTFDTAQLSKGVKVLVAMALKKLG